LQDKKGELGLSHFEVRTYQAVMRHLYITMVSHLFLARQTQRLRGENPAITLSQVRSVEMQAAAENAAKTRSRHLRVG